MMKRLLIIALLLIPLSGAETVTVGGTLHTVQVGNQTLAWFDGGTPVMCSPSCTMSFSKSMNQSGGCNVTELRSILGGVNTTIKTGFSNVTGGLNYVSNISRGTVTPSQMTSYMEVLKGDMLNLFDNKIKFYFESEFGSWRLCQNEKDIIRNGWDDANQSLQLCRMETSQNTQELNKYKEDLDQMFYVLIVMAAVCVILALGLMGKLPWAKKQMGIE